MKIIALEGQDGVGKSTQLEILKDKLVNQGYKVYSEHFPRYNTPIGELIGKVLDGERVMPSFDAMQMLYAADQVDFKNKLDELKSEGYDYVLLDRYSLSTIVYYCSKMRSYSGLGKILGWQSGIVKPDITVILTSDKSINDKAKYKELDRFEQDVEFMREISNGYKNIPHILSLDTPCVFVSSDVCINNVALRIHEELQKNNII